MGISDYIEKLRSKPEKHRERIAFIATGVAFLLIFLIWIISFSEANRISNEAQNASAGNGLEDLKSSIGNDKQSIQNMMESLPQGDTSAGENIPAVPDQIQKNEENPRESIPANQSDMPEKIEEAPSNKNMSPAIPNLP